MESTSKSPDGTCFLKFYVRTLGRDDEHEKQILKEKLATQFEVKDLGRLTYFLRIEVAYSNNDIFISQRKYGIDLLKETSMIDCKTTRVPIEQNHKICSDEGTIVNKGQYQRLVRKLINLAHTIPNIAYIVSVISHFMHDSKERHLQASRKGIIVQEKSTIGYCMFLGGNLVTWRSKKQNVVARSGAEAMVQTMAQWKPGGTAEETEKHFGCEASRLIMVGDRPFTDIVYGNRNGFLTILTEPLSLAEEPFIVKQVRKLENSFVRYWSRRGLKPLGQSLLPDPNICDFGNAFDVGVIPFNTDGWRLLEIAYHWRLLEIAFVEWCIVDSAIKSRKLSPKFFGPYELFRRIRPLANLHNVFHVSQLRKYVPDPTHVLELDNIQVREDLTVEAGPTKKLRGKEIRTMKEYLRKEYPHLFK
ncbi:hypothetical protein V8G54_032093 [Vigna mungo]|uniref:Mitochondrial protein n=1 Tax=Vigna mungo TaxID=3915 RepID=A0AAQ3MLD6_VIGMU